MTRLLALAALVAMALAAGGQPISPQAAASRIWGAYTGARLAMDMCSSRFPAGAEDFQASIDPWLKRNRATALKAREVLRAQLSSKAGIGSSSWETVQEVVREQLLGEINNELHRNGEKYCHAVTASLSNHDGDLEKQMPREVEAVRKAAAK